MTTEATGQGVSRADISKWFEYHPPTQQQLPKYQAIRDGAKDLAFTILSNTPPGPDQTAAIRLLRDTVMTANQSIACEGT